MIVVALVLLVLVAVFSLAIVVSNPDVYDLSIFRVLIPVTSTGVYLTGVGAAVLVVIALWLLRTGIRRSRARRLQHKSAIASDNPSAVPAQVDSDPTQTPVRTSTLDLDRPPPPAAERQALLDEVDRVSPDDSAK